MVIENRGLSAGTRLEATYRKQHYACIVSAGEDGKNVYTLEDGRTFKSPSAAGSAVMGGTACNGWRWWGIEGAAPPSTETPPKAAKPEQAPKAGRGKPNIRRLEHPTEQGASAACPQGHPAVVTDTMPTE